MKTRKPGRPPTGRPTGRKATIYLLPDTEARAKEIGSGNLSDGIRKAVMYASLSGVMSKKARDE